MVSYILSLRFSAVGKCHGPHGMFPLHLSVGIRKINGIHCIFPLHLSERIPFRYLVPGTWANGDGGVGVGWGRGYIKKQENKTHIKLK